MKLFAPLYDKVMQWSASPRATTWLAVLSFLESIIFPIPVDVMLMPMAYRNPEKAWRFAAITTVMSVLGGVVGYLLGFFAFTMLADFIEAIHYTQKLQAAQGLYAEWGFWATFVAGFSPIPYKVFTITAGSLAMSLPLFILASALSRGVRFFLVAGLAAKLGPAYETRIRHYIEQIGWITVGVLIVAIVIFYLWG